jgi:DNA-binding NarL/FixJ family response regulator
MVRPFQPLRIYSIAIYPMSDRPVKLILVDEDSLWRLGLSTALTRGDGLQGSLPNNRPDQLQIIAEAAQLEEFLGGELTAIPDVLVLGMTGHDLDRLWQPCQQIQQRFPQLNILLLSIPLSPEELSQARVRGIKGYCLRTEAIATILTAIDRVAQGEYFWSEGVSIDSLDTSSTKINFTPLPNTTFLYSQAITGIGQIDHELARINSYLQQSQISNINWLFWTGRRRELRTARWIINQLLPIDTTNYSRNVPISEIAITENDGDQYSPGSSGNLVLSEAINQVASQSIVANSIGVRIYELVQLQLGNELVNLTSNTLEIDVLSPGKKKDLLSLVLQGFMTLCEDLSLSQTDQEYITTKKNQLLQDLWATTITDFFGKYSSLRIGGEELEIVPVLLLDMPIILEEILKRIPFVEELLSQILFGTNLTIDDSIYTATSGEAIARAELILENLIIQVANAVIQPLLNRFSDIETIKLAFYDQQLLSVRDITKFRNDLSWKYRLDNYFYEPKLIFESSYQLYILSELGIRTTQIYAPRTLELTSLTGVRYFVTLWLEIKDAIAPRLKTLTSFLGRGLVYVLTQIIGRGLGLVGKGILQGIGSSFQEARAGRGVRK